MTVEERSTLAGRPAADRPSSRLEGKEGSRKALGLRRRCRFVKEDSSPCGSPPLQDDEFCFMHSPQHSEEAAAARRLGGARGRKEKAISILYDFDGLDTVTEIRRLLHIAVVDALHLENSVARARALAYLARVALRALEVGELDERLRALEGVVYERRIERKGGWR